MFVLVYVFSLLQASGAFTCGNGVGPNADTEGGCRCTWPYTCDATECEVGSARCMVPYPKTVVDSNRTVTQHVCSGHGFFSRAYGRCLCDFGWETAYGGIGVQTDHGYYQCNVRSSGSGVGAHPYPWPHQVSFGEESQCDCSMQWSRYAHKTVVYDGSLVRMWGVHVETLNASSVALAEQIARQLCYLHYDCQAVVISSASLVSHLYTVKFYQHGTGTIVWTDRIQDSPASTTFRVQRYRWNQDVATAGCDSTVAVDPLHLVDQQLARYKGTTAVVAGNTADQVWQHQRFYEYFHRHPELLTPYSDCKRAQPATGSSCEYPLCPPYQTGVGVGITGPAFPCSSRGYCNSAATHEAVLSRVDDDSHVSCTCDLGYQFYTTAGGYENACQVSTLGLCSSGVPCDDDTCCSGRGDCQLSVDGKAGEVTAHCNCGSSSSVDDYTGKYCNRTVCNQGLASSETCLAKKSGLCLWNRHAGEHQCYCDFSKDTSRAYTSSIRVWNTTSNEPDIYDEQDANCDVVLSSAQRFMCYEPASSSSTEPTHGVQECNGNGHCFRIDCTEFDTVDSCRGFPQACKWEFTDSTHGSCVSWVAGITYTCACDSGLRSNPSWFHGKALSHNDMPEHCQWHVAECTACEPEFGLCAKDGKGTPVCSCYEDSNGFVMADGSTCQHSLYNDTDCTLVYGGSDNSVTLGCVCADNDGPYCNITCPVALSGLDCDSRTCTLSGEASCGTVSTNATDCVCICNDDVESHSHSVLSPEGYCRNPCNDNGLWKFLTGGWGCSCVYGSSSPHSGVSTGYTGAACETFTCHASSAWDPTLGEDGQCVCAAGHSGHDCDSCESGFYKDDSNSCVICPDCAAGPHSAGSTCEPDGSCNCPATHPAVLSLTCSVSACVNTTGGNCNGTWGACHHYDVTTGSAVCDCQVWAYGTTHFGGKHDGDNWWNDCTRSSNVSCGSRGYKISSGFDSECHCDDAFYGENCEFYRDDSSCTATEEWDPTTGTCQCQFDYFGPLCNISCQTQYCNNVTASCTDSPSGSDPVTCNCPDHITIDGQQCAETYRLYTCNDQGDRPTSGVYPTCDCDQGFLQPTCKDDCRSSICNGHGTCATDDQVGDQNCTCDGNWIGARCDMHQCSGNGVVVGIGQSCNCANGWVGSTCCEHATHCNGRADVIVSGGECMCDCGPGLEQPHCTYPANESANDHDVHHIIKLTTAIPSHYVRSRDVVWISVASAFGLALIVFVVVVVVYIRYKAKLRAQLGSKDAQKVEDIASGVGGAVRQMTGAFRRRFVRRQGKRV